MAKKVWFQCKRFPAQTLVIRAGDRVIDRNGNAVFLRGKAVNFADGVLGVDASDGETLGKIRNSPDFVNGLITEHDEIPGATVVKQGVLTNGVDSGSFKKEVVATVPVGEPISAGSVKVPKRRKK